MSSLALAGLPAVSDEEIVRRVLEGDTASFEILVRRHNQRLYRAAYAILRDANEAEDVLQESYVRAYEHLAQFAGRASFATWLTRIAVNEALGRLRSRRQIDLYDTVPEPGEHVMTWTPIARDPEQQTSDSQFRAALEKAIEDLPGIYRIVFVLRTVQGLSVAETSESLDIAEETVKTRLHRARSLLRRSLWKKFGTARDEVFAFMGHRCDRVTAAVMARIAPRP